MDDNEKSKTNRQERGLQPIKVKADDKGVTVSAFALESWPWALLSISARTPAALSL